MILFNKNTTNMYMYSFLISKKMKYKGVKLLFVAKLDECRTFF